MCHVDILSSLPFMKWSRSNLKTLNLMISRPSGNSLKKSHIAWNTLIRWWINSLGSLEIISKADRKWSLVLSRLLVLNRIPNIGRRADLLVEILLFWRKKVKLKAFWAEVFYNQQNNLVKKAGQIWPHLSLVWTARILTIPIIISDSKVNSSGKSDFWRLTDQYSKSTKTFQ
jgi:hypothetical protein